MDLVPFFRTQIDALRLIAGFSAQESSYSLPQDFAAADFLSSVGGLCRVEMDFLHPELKGLFRGADSIVAQCVKEISELNDVIKAGAAGWKKMSEVEARDWVARVFTHFTYLERELLPRVRQHMETEQREELVVIMADAMRSSWMKIKKAGKLAGTGPAAIFGVP